MKVKGNDLAGGGAGALIAWLWNSYNPDMTMPAEVAAVVGGLLGPVVRYLVGWLPESPGSLPTNGTGDGHATDPQRQENQTRNEENLRREEG